MKLWGFAFVAIGCTTEPPVLRVEPGVIDLDVELGEMAPQVDLRVLADDNDVTASATFAVTGTALGTMAAARFTSDGHTGGVAVIAVAAAGATATVPVTATVHETRLVAGAPDSTPTWFPPGPDVSVVAPLEPGDGAVVAPNLGKLDVDFGADDADDVHEVAVTAPHLDLHIYAPGAPGPRHVELDADEWLAIASTTRGNSVALAVRSTKSGGGAPVHRMTARLAVADLDVKTLVFSGAAADPNGVVTGTPSLYRYQPSLATVESFVGPAGDDHAGCIGCHVSISADGKRIAAGGTLSATGSLVGLVVDTSARAVVASSDTALPWSTSAFDPTGALVTSYQANGNLILRDGNTAAPIATLATGEAAAAPAISPDGHLLAYVALPSAGNTFVGTALRVRTWDVATAALGPPTTLAADTGVMAPQFSPDGAWLLYSRTSSVDSAVTQATMIVRADSSAPAVALTTGAGDEIPRWASPIATAMAGGRDPEPMAWIVFSSARAIGPVPMPGQARGLWLAAFYPQRGVVGRPFHLPGQSPALSSLHAPVFLP